MSHHELPKMTETREDPSQPPNPSSNNSELTHPYPIIPSDIWEETKSSSLNKYLQDLSEVEWHHLSEAMHDPMTKKQFFEVCITIVKIVSLSSMKLVIPAYIHMLQDAKTKGSSKSPNTAISSSAQDIAKRTLEPLEAVVELTGEGVQQGVAENLKSLAADQSEGTDISFCSHELTCALVREVMFRMIATLKALGKTATQCSRRGAERMIHQVTNKINICLASQKARQKSASTPEIRSSVTNVASTTGEVMAVVIQTMESHLDDQDQYAKEVLSTVAATVKMMETQSAAMEHLYDLMDIGVSEDQSQTQKGVRTSSRHSTQSIDKLSDTEFQEKARNIVSDVLSKRLPGSTALLSRPSSAVTNQSDRCGDEKGGIPSLSVTDLAAAAITDMFVEEIIYLVESTESFTELTEQESVELTGGKMDVKSAALELFQKMKDKVIDISNQTKPESLEEGSTEMSEAPVTDQEEDVESCTKEIVSKIVVLYKSVSENEDANSLYSHTSRESSVKMNFVDNVFAQLENLTHSPENIQEDSNKDLQSSFVPNSNVCLHTLSGKTFQSEAIQVVSDVLKKSVTALSTLTVPEISANANQGSEVAACEIVELFVQEVGSFAQLVQGSESIEGSASPPEPEAPDDECSITDDQRTTAALNVYQTVKSWVKKYFIGNTIEKATPPQDDKVVCASSSLDALNEADLEAVDSCTKSVIGEIIGVYKSKAAEEDTEQPVQNMGGIMSELEGMMHSIEAPKSAPYGSKNISTRSSASSIQYLSAALQKISSENILNQVTKQVSKVLLKSVQVRAGSNTSVPQNGSVSLSEAELTALDVTDTVVKGVESLLQCPEILEITGQEDGVTESLISSDSFSEKRKPIWSNTWGIFQNLQGKVKDFISKHHASDDKMGQTDSTQSFDAVPVSTQDEQPDSVDSTKKASSSKEFDTFTGSLSEEKLQSFSKDLTDRVRGILLDSNVGPQIIKLIAGKSTSDSVLYMKENKHAEKKKHAALEMVYDFAEEAIRSLLQPYFRLPSNLNTDEEYPAYPVYSKIIDLFTRVMVRQVMDNLGTVLSDEDLVSSRPPISKSSHELVAPCLSDNIIGDPQHLEEYSDTADSSLPELDSDDYICLVTMLILRLLAKNKDQELVSGDLMEATKDLTKKVLLEFTDVLGIQKSSSHPPDAKLKRVYRVIHDDLMKEFGTITALKTIVTEDLSFDQLLIMTLTRELLHTCDIQDPTTLKAPQPGRTPRLRINVKRHKFNNAKVGPMQEDQGTNPCEGTSTPSVPEEGASVEPNGSKDVKEVNL